MLQYYESLYVRVRVRVHKKEADKSRAARSSVRDAQQTTYGTPSARTSL